MPSLIQKTVDARKSPRSKMSLREDRAQVGHPLDIRHGCLVY
jgi:hypothetical protein